MNTIHSEHNQRTPTKVLGLCGSEAKNEAGLSAFPVRKVFSLRLTLAAEFLLDLAGKSAELS